MKKILLFISIFFTNIFFAQDGTIDPAYNTGTGFDNTVFYITI
jgi:ribosomal protein L27